MMRRGMSRTIFHACTHMFLAVFVGCFFLVTSGEAASFDCSQARAQIEKLICGDPQVSKMDEDLAAVYADLLTKTADLKAIKAQQREWLINLRKHCNNIACLKNMYALRITALATAKQAEGDLSAKSIAANMETCRLVAEYANRGDLDSISVQPTVPRPEQEKLKRLMGEGVELPEYVSYWAIDLDHDGSPEHFIVVLDPEMGEGYALARSRKNGSTLAGVNDNEDKNITLSVLSLNGRYYILSSTLPKLGKLWRLARNGEFVNMCKFSQREEPVIERSDGKENPVCRDAKDNRIPPVAFSNMHAISAVPQEPRLRLSYPSEDLARIDIDNDGQVDNVVRFTTTLGSYGCETQYFATTDITRTRIPGTALNDLLYSALGTDRCSRNLEILVHGGVTYVGIQSWTPDYAVYRIKNDMAKTVCEFPGRVINEVVDDDQEAAK